MTHCNVRRNPDNNSSVEAPEQHDSQTITFGPMFDIDDMATTQKGDGARKEKGIEGDLQRTRKACNECRQQKLRCNAVQEPYSPCSRCIRLKIECKTNSTFRRVRKRDKYTEMQREIDRLKQKPASLEPTAAGSLSTQQLHGQINSLSSAVVEPRSRRLEVLTISVERLSLLFEQFFTFYHPFLPFLDEQKSPDHYFDLSPLLGWIIAAIGARRSRSEPHLLETLQAPVTKLLWATIAQMHQPYHTVKALCLLCTWPFPVSSNSSDPTFMISGIMMQMAMQAGLHRPFYAQDFSKFRLDANDIDMKDRVRTWAACKIVSQYVATGYGQPSTETYDWTLGPSLVDHSTCKLSAELGIHLRVVKFCQKVTKTLYCNHSDPTGLLDDQQARTGFKLLEEELRELAISLKAEALPITTLHMLGAGLHLHSYVFLISNRTSCFQEDLSSMYYESTTFLQAALDLEASTGRLLDYCCNFLFLMFLVAGCALIKILNSTFATYVDLVHGKTLFNGVVLAMRKISVRPDDMADRLAEKLTHIWQAEGSGIQSERTLLHKDEDSLRLIIRCRMSVSHVFDCIWEWQSRVQNKERPVEYRCSARRTPDLSNPSTSGMSSYESNIQADAFSPAITLGLELGNIYEGDYADLLNSTNWMLDGFNDFSANALPQ